MAYIGKQPTVGNFVKLDAITTSATTTFNLLNGGVAYSPQSANHCLVSLNGVIQEPTTAGDVGGFSISGSTIVFTSALTSADVIDFILVLGDVLNIGTPSDGTVTTPKLASGITTTHALGSASVPSITFTGDTNTGIFSPTADTIAFTEGGAEAMRINSDGNVALAKNISIGGATPTTSGFGITFPASQSASTDANTLDDYEEGTWTAGFAGSSATATGNYTKIGNKVYVNVFGQAFSVTSAVPSNITGLPFTNAALITDYTAGTVAYNTYTLNGGGNGYFVPNTTRWDFISENQLTQPNSVVGIVNVMMSGFYKVA